MKLPFARNKFDAITNCLEDLILTKNAGGQTIIFTNTKEDADNLVSNDCFGSYRSQVLHGDISQNARLTTIKQFREGQLDVLVATDVAARGLDIAGVDLVIHTGIPNDHDTYVHRSGRTGRAGRNGTSITVYSTGDERKLYSLENILNFKFQRASLPTAEEICEVSAQSAIKKIMKVEDNAAESFLPYARQIISEGITDEDTNMEEKILK